MEIQTIQQIKEKIKMVDSALKNIDLKGLEDVRYGDDKEYTLESLNNDLKALLTDLRGLVRAPDRFLKLSTHPERTEIYEHLKSMVRCLANKD